MGPAGCGCCRSTCTPSNRGVARMAGTGRASSIALSMAVQSPSRGSGGQRLHNLKASPLPKLLTTASLWEEVCPGQRKEQSRTRSEGHWDQSHRPFQLESCASFLRSCYCCFSYFLYLSCLWIFHFLKPPSFLRESVFYSKQEKIKKISLSILYLSNPGVLCKLSCVMSFLFLSIPTPLPHV